VNWLFDLFARWAEAVLRERARRQAAIDEDDRLLREEFEAAERRQQ